MPSRTLMQSSLVLAVVVLLVNLLASPSWSAGASPGTEASSQASASPGAAVAAGAGQRLIVHEWGTFTSLQDEAGRSIAGINTDDEPVPDFVHRLAGELLIRPGSLAPIYFKGIPRCHRSVVMRLETPVMYFHPPAGAALPMKLNVWVAFRGGWLSEFYPNAQFNAPGFDARRGAFGLITPDTVGTLAWNGLAITDAPTAGPATDARVWLAPRNVDAAPVATAAGEDERYLFYRGVGSLEAPLRVTRSTHDGRDTLAIRSRLDPSLDIKAPLTVPVMWLVDVQDGGAVAYRALGPVTLTGDGDRVLATTPAGFIDHAHTTANQSRLRAEMRAALISDGLFADEAEAMLATWELAYFKSPGLRLFFLMPQTWTDAVLPVTLSVPADLKRTMVGRIELVTPHQRQLLARIARGPTSPSQWLYDALEGRPQRAELFNGLFIGKITLRELNMQVPEDYQAYVDLGRFRNALVLDEATRRPTDALHQFTENYHLNYFDPDGGR